MSTTIVFLLQAALLVGACVAFQQQVLPGKVSSRQTIQSVPLMMAERNEDTENAFGRRNFLATSTAAVATGLLSFQQSAMAIPMATVDEFDTILRDSPLSVNVVEFSGPRSENVVVKLVDGTVFGVKDIVESPTDPRSPLKLAADCREANVKTKFVDFEAMLSGSPKKKKLYTNERVQKAYELQAAQKERIRQDELERLRQVALMEEQEKAAAAAAAAPPAVSE
ncbi:unnamed protein product [Pseudo-nitzschia multistriata]|uniref:Uncharacterized protein n=1 Tax=Pseudo-nitzschia multistriata TaxID=183589 RepID=A0A448Z938_9STRA|nr:unnamed protein product [Pseudo-nitzschia multistriata]